MKISYGSTRIVFVFDIFDFVIKIPALYNIKSLKRGYKSNRQEYIYSKLKRSDLCEVIFNMLNLVIVMKKADVVDINCNWLKFHEYVENKYKNDELKDFMLEDLKPTNWGILNNMLVKIDYGYND